MQNKFRAWDPVKKEFIQYFWLDQNGEFHDDNGYDEPVNLRSKDEQPIVTRFIGLKDVYGKEIFESDILEETRTGDAVCVNFDYSFLNEISKYCNRALRIIGNIWENGELLNDTK